ncbi:MAG: hypothetical protein WBQ89_27630 [Candidatus Acidiferrum sp.]
MRFVIISQDVSYVAALEEQAELAKEDFITNAISGDAEDIQSAHTTAKDASAFACQRLTS